MTFATRLNALDQALDIAGSLTQVSNLTLTDEMNGLGVPISGQTGSSAVISAVISGLATVTGLSGMTAQSVGHFLQLSMDAGSPGNDGTFLIDTYISGSSVKIVNPNAVADAYAMPWVERHPYSLEADLNYVRTDRAAIKGVGYDAPIPVYQRPTAIGTFVPANLANISGYTTDAVAYVVNRSIFGIAVAAADTQVTVTSVGNFKHADPVDNTGIPCFDAAPFVNDMASAYVHVVDGYLTGSEITVLAGAHIGERIFGVCYAGASTSPNSVEVHFYSAPFAVNYNSMSNATPYTWEANQTTTINLLYGYNEVLANLDKNALRSVPALGILTDAQLSGDINNILEQIGSTSGDTSLNTLLTNLTQYYPFSQLDATPTVVSALNILNQQVGNLTFTGNGPINSTDDGYTVTQLIQNLSNAISLSTITRTVEVVSSTITANTVHTLPGGLTYTQDASNNGNYLFVYWRGLLRNPGPISASADYAETSTTSITPYATIKAGDVINYFTK